MTTNPIEFGNTFVLTLLTSSVDLAIAAERAGIQRIGIDIERNGKADRQLGFDTRISDHTWSDLITIKKALSKSELFIRLNPPHQNTVSEIEMAINLGASVLMLPYFHSESEAKEFSELVRGRAYTILLVETPRALVRIQEVAAVRGIDEIMIGLNDLRLTMNLRGLEFLTSPLMSMVSRTVRDSGKRFTFGGLGRYDDRSLPTNPDLIYAQYPRLFGTGAWLARSFFRNSPAHLTIEDSIKRLRSRLSFWASQSDETLKNARHQLALQSLDT